MRGSQERAPRRGWVRRLVESSYVVLLAGFLAVVDFRLHANPWTAAALVLTAVAGVIAAPLLGRLVARLRLSRRPAIRVLLAAAPVVALAVTRWRGGAALVPALVAIAVPLALSLSLAALGPRLDRVFAPYARRRDRIAPRWLRSLLAGLLPVVVTFWFVHGSLRDIGALVGLSPARQTPVGAVTWRVVVGSAVAVVLVFLLLRGPAPAAAPARRSVAARTVPAAATVFLLLGLAGLAAAGYGALAASSALASPSGPTTALAAQHDRPTHVVDTVGPLSAVGPLPGEDYGDEVCPEGFYWARMSANGCVQRPETIPSNGGGLTYESYPICRDPAYPHMITEWRETPTGEPIPGSGGKTALPFLLDCLSDAEYQAYLAQGGATGETPSTAANAAWVVGGGAVAAASLVAAAAAAGWTETSEPSETFTSERCQSLTRRRNDLVARQRRLADLAGQRQGVIELLRQARAQHAATSADEGTDWIGLGATAGNYGATVTGGAGSAYTAAVKTGRIAGTPTRLAVAGTAAGRVVGGFGAAASATSTYRTLSQTYATEGEAARAEAQRLAALTARRWADQVTRLERYQAWLEARLTPAVDRLRADVAAFNAEMDQMGTLEGWWCPATSLPAGPLDDLLADTPPEGYAGAFPEDSMAPGGLGHETPRFRRAPRGSCATYAADLARFRAHEASVRATVERLDDEARVWGQRVADANASARPLYAEVVRLAARHNLNLNLAAAAGGVSTSAAAAPVVAPGLVTSVVAAHPWAAVLLAATSLLASLAGDLVFTPSAAEAALIGRLSAQARFFDSRARYCQAEYEQRAVDRRTAWQQLLAERDELAQRYEDCGRIWEDDAAGRAAAPDQIEAGHAPCYFTATPRSMEELASW